MRPSLAWFTVAFCSVPAFFIACGGRSQINFDVDLYADGGAAGGGAGGAVSAGGASAGGKGGGSGASGKAGGAAGTGGAIAAGGNAGASAAGGGDAGATSTGGSGAGGTGTAGTGVGGKGGGGKGNGGKGGGGKDAGDIFDAFPLPDSGPIGMCVDCLKNNCDAQINACYNNPNCLAGIQCSIQKCFAGTGAGGMGMGVGGGTAMGVGGGTGMGVGGGTGAGGGGGVNFQCLLGCFNGDIGAAFSAIQAFQCVSMSCGSACTGGLGAGAGGGGGKGGSTGMVVDPFGGGPDGLSMDLYVDHVRIPEPNECPGYPELQQALSR